MLVLQLKSEYSGIYTICGESQVVRPSKTILNVSNSIRLLLLGLGIAKTGHFDPEHAGCVQNTRTTGGLIFSLIAMLAGAATWLTERQ